MEDENVHGILLMMFASANVDALSGVSGLLADLLAYGRLQKSRTERSLENKVNQ